jgi:transcription elongation factor Elf1
MGMFDTVRFYCPECDAEKEVQSKAGPCRLITYEYRDVPRAIAESLEGEVFTCGDCGTRFEIGEYREPEGVRMEARRV